MAEQFPENIQLGIAGTTIFPYAVVPGTYGFDDIDVFPEKIYEGAPRLDDYTGGPVSAQHDWSSGGGQYRFDNPKRFWESDLDTRFKGRIGLGTAATFMYQATYVASTMANCGAAGSPMDAQITHFKEWKGELYGFGGQFGYVLNKLSPTWAWSRLSPPLTGSLAGTITDVEVYDNYIWLAVGSSARSYFSASLLHTTISCTQAMSPIDAYAEQFEVLEGTFVKAASYVAGTRQYSDLKFSTTPLLEWTKPNRVGDTDQPISNLKIWNGLAWVFKPDGVYTFDSKGIAYDVLPEFKNYLDPQLGKYAVVHQNELYFNVLNSLKRFDGEKIYDVHPRQFMESVQERMPVDAWAGDITGLLPSDSWLWITGLAAAVRTHNILTYDNTAQPGEGWHGLYLNRVADYTWMRAPYYSTIAPSGQEAPHIFTALRQLTSLGVQETGQLIQRVRLPIGSHDPADDSSVPYSSTGSCYESEMDLDLDDQDKAILYLRLHILNIGAGGEVGIQYFLDGATGTPTSLETITQAKVPTDKWVTVSTSLTCKKVVWRLDIIRNSDGSSPYVDSFAVYWHVRPRRMGEWNMQLLLAPNAVEGDTRGVGQMDEHLTTMRDRAGSIAFVNRLGSSYSVFLTKYSLKEVLKEGQQSPETVADVQLKQYVTPS